VTPPRIGPLYVWLAAGLGAALLARLADALSLSSAAALTLGVVYFASVVVIMLLLARRRRSHQPSIEQSSEP
jgi:membrane protein implicated in regulation of membrane protease activity